MRVGASWIVGGHADHFDPRGHRADEQFPEDSQTGLRVDEATDKLVRDRSNQST